jgi:tetratricopeptide (TPR) repeat protein
MYLSQDRREEAIKLFKQAILEERHPYLKEFRTAEMLVELYPSDRKRLREAKKHLEKSLELEPNYHRTRVVLMNLDRFLSSTETSTN